MLSFTPPLQIVGEEGRRNLVRQYLEQDIEVNEKINKILWLKLVKSVNFDRKSRKSIDYIYWGFIILIEI